MQGFLRLKVNKNVWGCTALVGVVTILGGCAATATAIEHGHLQASTKLSETIFLDPVPHAQKTIYISVKNTSDQTINVAPKLKESFREHGFRVVNQVGDAHYLLQANILKVGKMSVAASQSALGGGFGSVLAGGAVGAGLGSLTHNTNAMIGGGIAGGLVGLAADSLVKDVNYTMITDVQISERVGQGVKVQEEHRASLKQGSSTQLTQVSSRESQYQRYRTRVVSNADRVNLAFKDAVPSLEAGLVKTLTSIF